MQHSEDSHQETVKHDNPGIHCLYCVSFGLEDFWIFCMNWLLSKSLQSEPLPTLIFRQIIITLIINFITTSSISMPPTSTTSADLATASSWPSSFHATHQHLYHLLLLLSGHHHTFQNPVYGYFSPSPFCPPHQQGELNVEFHILHNNGLHLRDIYNDRSIHRQNVISLSVITRSN